MSCRAPWWQGPELVQLAAASLLPGPWKMWGVPDLHSPESDAGTPLPRGSMLVTVQSGLYSRKEPRLPAPQPGQLLVVRDCAWGLDIRADDVPKLSLSASTVHGIFLG